jgi:hypothetical protein
LKNVKWPTLETRQHCPTNLKSKVALSEHLFFISAFISTYRNHFFHALLASDHIGRAK